MFENIFAFNWKEETKPKAPEKLKVLVNQVKTYLVGDSHSDLLAAKRLGVPFLQSTWIVKKDLAEQVEIGNPLELFKYID